MEILIDNIIVENRKRKINPEKVGALALSIERIGLQNPIIVKNENSHYRLIAGYHRLEAIKILKWPKIECNEYNQDGLFLELAEIDENLIRNDLTVIEQAEHLQRRNEILEQMGERREVGRYQSNGDTVSPLKTTKDIAKEVGLSERSTQRRCQIARAIIPKVRDMIRSVETISDSTIQLLNLSRQEPEMQERIGRLLADGTAKSFVDARARIYREESKNIKPPEGKYQVIYADPPWSYGKVDDNYGPANRHYNTMTSEELLAFPVKDMAFDDAILFLWVTVPKLEEGLELAKAWGFKYKGQFIWDKVKHNFGRINSIRHEILLICMKGSFGPQELKLFDSVQTIERTKKHSEKPEEFRKIIDTLYPSATKRELFGRKQIEGWDVWGSEF